MLDPGMVLLSRFVVEEQIGQGGMGTLYRALDRERSGRVAVKVLAGGGDEDRFSREAQALCALAHPAIVRYVAEGSTARGERLLVMEWLEGEDLAARLSRGPLSIGEGIRVCTRVAEALGYAHRLGIIHRDIKPSNLFVPGGRLDDVKVIDFGLVRFLQAGTRATTYHLVLGTPGYLAPEQARGEPRIDARADVFALGCVLFECLAGRPVFDGESVLAILTQIVLATAPRLSSLVPGVPEVLDDLVARMLAKRPEERPPDGDDVARALGGIEGDLVAPARASVPDIPSGERRLLSIFLARPAEAPVGDETVPMLAADSGAWDAIERVVVSLDACLEQLADGSIVAVVSSSGAATDQAARAGRIALALQGRLQGWRMALATGLGESSGGPFGDVVDRAARLLGPPSSIRIDELTAGLLGDRFEVGPSGPDSELRGERAQPPASRVLLGKPAPCVGRERERALLRGLFEECVADRVARAALITGPVGAGKSRLRHELVKEVGSRAFVVTGRGDDLRRGTPFGVLAPGLRAAMGIRDDVPPPVRREQLRAWVVAHPAIADARRVIEFLGEMVGVPAADASLPLQVARRDADLMSDQMLRAFVEVVGAVGATRAVLIVLDDLQWGDQPSLSFVEAALSLPDCPVFVLALGRPEVREAFPSLRRGRAWQGIDLPPLPARACRRLIEAVLGDTTAADRIDRIVEQAAGNAFFLEELIRAEAAGAGDVVPATVLAMMHGRLSALAPDVRRTACLASVFGRAFSAPAVEAIGGLRDSLEALVALELVHRRTSSIPELAFRHDLVRQAAYAMLDDEDRKAAHSGAAEWLGRSGDADPAVLAHHLERAGRRERAAVAYLAAARGALVRHDTAAALERAGACVRCGPPDPVRAEAYMIQGEARWWQGDMAAALGPLGEARALMAQRAPLLAEVLAWSSRTYARMGQPDEAIACATRMLEADLRGAHLLRLLRAARGVLTSMPQLGRTDLAEQLLTRLREAVAAGPTEPVLEAELFLLGGLRALSVGDHWTHVRLIEEVVALQEAAGDLRNPIHARINAGFSLAELGALERAEAMIRRAEADATKYGHTGLLAGIWQNLGLVQLRLGRLDEARATLSRSAEGYRAQLAPADEGCTRLYLARVEEAAGSLEDAEREARHAATLVAGFPSSLAHAQATLARIALARGRLADALELATSAMALHESGLDFEEGESVVYLALAESLLAVGRREDATRVAAAGRDVIEARAARIGDPELRASFSTRVQENAALVALAHALSSPR